MRLFVYGTLKRGMRNHRLMGGLPFAGPAATAPGFRLYDLGPYPALVPDPAGGGVRGELFDATGCPLDELDDFEGVPHLFDRRPIPLADGTTAWAYLYVRAVPSGAAAGDEWPFAPRG